MAQAQSNSIKLLNAAQAFIVKFANDNQVNLEAEFGTVEKFKEFVIAITFKTLVDAGIAVNEAFDLVMGDGAYSKLASDLWNSFQAK